MIFPLLSSTASLVSFLSLYALFITTNNFPVVDAAETPIQISSTLGTMNFDTTTSPGISTIPVSYVMDVATLGASTDAKDFYVLQSLQDGTNCDLPSGLTFTSLNGATEPTLTAADASLTTLVNTADWPRGATTFCLRMQLMLQMSDNVDKLWHQMDFQITVTVSFADGTASVTYSGNSIAENMNFDSAGTQTGTGADVGVAPTFTTSIGGTSFAYGQDIPITIDFVHPMNVFTYSVDLAGVIPVSDLVGTQLTINSKPVALRSKTFTDTFSFTGAGGTIGIVTITLPLIVYQDTSISSVKILIPVSYVNKARRGLRSLESQGGGKYTGPASGVVDEVVEIQLEPYMDESGAIVGFTVTSIVSTMCVGATALLF